MHQWNWIGERDALAIHERSLVLHGGTPGLHEFGLLQSVLAGPRQLATYQSNADGCALAASYTAGILHSHPFIDGNTRTGFVVGILFLELNGARFTASEEEAATMVIRLAAGELDQAGYRLFLAETTTSD